jgi:hypothetical protein
VSMVLLYRAGGAVTIGMRQDAILAGQATLWEDSRARVITPLAR